MGQTPLYRTEVIEARRNRWLGALLLRQPLSHWVLTWVAVAIAFGIGATLYWGEYTRRVRVVGELVSGKDDATLQALLSIPESALASARIGGDVERRKAGLLVDRRHVRALLQRGDRAYRIEVVGGL